MNINTSDIHQIYRILSNVCAVSHFFNGDLDQFQMLYKSLK
jgi:hypothetical protein